MSWQDDIAHKARQASPHDFGSAPLYLIEWHDAEHVIGPAMPGGVTANCLDLQLRPWLEERGQWQGRGPCVVANSKNGGAELGFEGLLIHELSHVIEGPRQASEEAIIELATTTGWSATGKTLSQYLLENRTCEIAPEPWLTGGEHGLPFIRATLHLYSRWPSNDLTLRWVPVAGELYGLSPAWLYLANLIPELETRRDEPIRDILATDPPEPFAELFAADKRRWKEKQNVS